MRHVSCARALRRPQVGWALLPVRMDVYCVPACVHGHCDVTDSPINPNNHSHVPPQVAACVCDRFWSGTACTVRYDHKMAPWWQVFIALTAVLQASVVVFGLANIIMRQVSARRVMGKHARAWRGSYRDVVQVLTMMGSALRCVWLVDPESFNVRTSCGAGRERAAWWPA